VLAGGELAMEKLVEELLAEMEKNRPAPKRADKSKSSTRAA